MDVAERLLRGHLRRHRSTLTGGALCGVAGVGGVRYWSPAAIRADAATVALFDPTSCMASAAAVAREFGGSVVLAYALREPTPFYGFSRDQPSLCGFALASDGRTLLDAAARQYGTARGILGAALGRDDLDRLLAPDLREGLEAIGAR